VSSPCTSLDSSAMHQLQETPATNSPGLCPGWNPFPERLVQPSWDNGPGPAAALMETLPLARG
ncbi:hypothetical protein HGM15179_011647, partial [Zosterops borbonicus]